jgi:hypothetical protein
MQALHSLQAGNFGLQNPPQGGRCVARGQRQWVGAMLCSLACRRHWQRAVRRARRSHICICC